MVDLIVLTGMSCQGKTHKVKEKDLSTVKDWIKLIEDKQ